MKIVEKINFYIFEKFIGEFVSPIYIKIRYGRRLTSSPTPKVTEINNIYIFNTDSFGDSLWITPLLINTKKVFPHAKIHLIINKNVASLFEQYRSLLEIHPIDSHHFSNPLFFDKIPKVNFINSPIDLAIIASMGSKPSNIAKILFKKLGAKYISTSTLGKLNFLCNFCLLSNTLLNLWWPEYFCSLLLPWIEKKIVPHGIKLNLSPLQSDIRRIPFIKSSKIQIVLNICVAPYANLTKRWPDLHFLKLAKLISKDFDVDFILTGSIEESMEISRFETLLKNNHINAINKCGIYSPNELYNFLFQCHFLITGDTFIFHLGVASGIETIGIFGATNEKHISPSEIHNAKNVTIFTDDIKCRPCHEPRNSYPYWPKCIYRTPLCLENITPEKIFLKVKTKIEENLKDVI